MAGLRRALVAALLRRSRLLSALALLFWLAWVVGAVASGRPFRPGWIGTLFLVLIAASLLQAWVASRRRMAIREGRLPLRVKRAWRQQHPTLEGKDADLVERGFRQFFMACARSEGKFVAMPSKAVDAYWHAFILDTRTYADWCERTLGRFLHHRPVDSLGGDAEANDGLRRAWFFACKDEAIDPRSPSRLPLLFALDAKLGIEGGKVYSPRQRPKLGGQGQGSRDGGGDVEITYADDFADDGFAGDADGLGGVDGSSDGGGGDGGGDGGGGCGGGGD